MRMDLVKPSISHTDVALRLVELRLMSWTAAVAEIYYPTTYYADPTACPVYDAIRTLEIERYGN